MRHKKTKRDYNLQMCSFTKIFWKDVLKAKTEMFDIIIGLVEMWESVKD